MEMKQRKVQQQIYINIPRQFLLSLPNVVTLLMPTKLRHAHCLIDAEVHNKSTLTSLLLLVLPLGT
jgi:hypothetical protein